MPTIINTLVVTPIYFKCGDQLLPIVDQHCFCGGLVDLTAGFFELYKFDGDSANGYGVMHGSCVVG